MPSKASNAVDVYISHGFHQRPLLHDSDNDDLYTTLISTTTSNAELKLALMFFNLKTPAPRYPANVHDDDNGHQMNSSQSEAVTSLAGVLRKA